MSNDGVHCSLAFYVLPNPFPPKAATQPHNQQWGLACCSFQLPHWGKEHRSQQVVCSFIPFGMDHVSPTSSNNNLRTAEREGTLWITKSLACIAGGQGEKGSGRSLKRSSGYFLQDSVSSLSRNTGALQKDENAFNEHSIQCFVKNERPAISCFKKNLSTALDRESWRHSETHTHTQHWRLI